jgi:hypothetical protein
MGSRSRRSVVLSRRIRRIWDQSADKSLSLAILPHSPAPLRGFFVSMSARATVRGKFAGVVQLCFADQSMAAEAAAVLDLIVGDLGDWVPLA